MTQAAEIIDGLAAMGAPIEDGDRRLIQDWTDGRSLHELTNCRGWDVLMRLMQDLVTDATRNLLSVKPSHADVISLHATATDYASFADMLIKRVGLMIEDSRKPPEIAKKGAAVAMRFSGTEPLPGL